MAFTIENGILKRYIEEPGITAIVIPDGVMSIEGFAFSNCEALKSIVIPNSMTSICYRAFIFCDSLTSIMIPNSVTSIGDEAFYKCRGLISFTIPNSVTSIGESAFYGCSSLSSITIPDSVTSIGAAAFCECSSLTSVKIPNSMTSIENRTFLDCISLASVTIPDSVTNIGGGAFYRCRSLMSVTIPDSVTSIGEQVFRGCNAMADTQGLIIVGDVLYDYTGKSSNIVIPEGVTRIGENAFYNRSSLKSVTIPDTITSIGEEAFSGCINLCIGFTSRSAVERCLSSFGKTFTFSYPLIHLKTQEKLPVFYARSSNDADAEAYAYVLLFQSNTSWAMWKASHVLDVKDVLKEALKILSTMENHSNTVINRLNDYVSDNVGKIDDTDIALFVEKYATLIPNAAKALKKDAKLEMRLGGKPRHEIEQYVSELKVIPNAEIAIAVKDGIPFADKSGVSSRDAVIAVITFYANLFTQNSRRQYGEMSSEIMILDSAKLRSSSNADYIAEALDKEALCSFLESKLNGSKYRQFMLAYARYASEERVHGIIAKIGKNARGMAKDRYWATNMTEALYLNDTLAAADYFDKQNKLARYAEMRGSSEADYRDSQMLPNFGLDDNSKKQFDIGGNTITFSVTPDLRVSLHDMAKKKEVKSFPKNSDDADLLNSCTVEYSELKKQVEAFISARMRMFKEMYLKDEKLSNISFTTTYLRHPILKHFVKLLVWTDEKGKCFTVNDQHGFVDVNDNEYMPNGSIRMAHVMEMDSAEIAAWQRYLDKHHQKQLFPQMWEPVVAAKGHSRIEDRYHGAVVTQKERNEFKKRMKERGLEVRADKMECEYDPRTNSYVYSNEGKLNIGSKTRIEYTVNPNAQTTTFGLLTSYSPPREMNIIVFEMDRMCLRHAVSVDDVFAVSKDRLDSMNVMQISDLLQCAINNGSINCTAMLLDYKNEKFGDYELDDFTLD